MIVSDVKWPFIALIRVGGEDRNSIVWHRVRCLVTAIMHYKEQDCSLFLSQDDNCLKIPIVMFFFFH